MGSIRCVGGIVHDVDGNLLLIRRGHEPGQGYWSLPGGRVEAGESDRDAVIRELREETGLSVHPERLVGTLVRGPYEIFDYACTARGGTLRAGGDADEARWIDAQAFTELDRAGALTGGLSNLLRSWDALPRR